MLAEHFAAETYSSIGGFNDGMIDVCLNPEAKYNKTVLRF